eukprot:CAMPEP_0185041980 /NCGR_PEP_ID=MMETSP1103-20130426/41921_1 /TAXON_ID=36769 /ORGANISM="Paraphysomonas bandaiensis, Strain Caron Lab Isolate" /LENGTH=431 /DNA_ID=CAMNT_0027581933 /DNA_START=156 /DNA_END=1451 /DNA_ORIENTATION=-
MKRKSPRTNIALFRELFGDDPSKDLIQGKKKLESLTDSGLFANVTMNRRSWFSPAGPGVDIDVDELQSVQVMPDIMISPSSSGTTVTGGVRVRDINFRGLGEGLNWRIGMIKSPINHNQGNSTFLSGLMPLVECEWRGREIGKTGFLSVGLSAEEAADGCRSRQMRNHPFETSFRHRLWMRSTRLYQGTSHGVRMSVEPYVSSVMPSSASPVLVSFRRALNSNWIQGSSAPVVPSPKLDLAADMKGLVSRLLLTSKVAYGSITCDTGNSEDGIFHTVDVALRTPLFALSGWSGEELAEDRVYLAGSVRADAHGAWGDGCVPSHHYVALRDRHIIRMLANSTVNGLVPAIASVKGDMYVKWPYQLVLPGVFVDGCAISQSGWDVKNTESIQFIGSYGVSMALGGVRVEVSWSAGGKLTDCRISIGPDISGSL